MNLGESNDFDPAKVFTELWNFIHKSSIVPSNLTPNQPNMILEPDSPCIDNSASTISENAESLTAKSDSNAIQANDQFQLNLAPPAPLATSIDPSSSLSSVVISGLSQGEKVGQIPENIEKNNSHANSLEISQEEEDHSDNHSDENNEDGEDELVRCDLFACYWC